MDVAQSIRVQTLNTFLQKKGECGFVSHVLVSRCGAITSNYKVHICGPKLDHTFGLPVIHTEAYIPEFR